MKDIVTNIEGTITKLLPSTAYASNTYYDVTANLDVRDYDGDHYYMWDAKQQYWHGYEWTKHLSGNTGQPTVNHNNSSSNYAHNNTDSRYYNGSYPGSGLSNPAIHSCKDLPNVNEMTWYVAYGDPRWDEDELWITMGHLYKGGMWLKKKSVLQGEGHYNSNTAYDGTDWRTNNTLQAWTPSLTLPSAADAGNYFYLPALGYYYSGQLESTGSTGYYWSSSANPWASTGAYVLYFYLSYIYVNSGGDRGYGYRAQKFTDFGDN